MKSKIMCAIEHATNGGILSNHIGRRKCINDFLSHAHRYLQMEFFEFILTYIKINAMHYQDEPDRWFDGRNINVGKICKDIVDNNQDYLKIFDYEKDNLKDSFCEFSQDADCRIDEDENINEY